MARITIELFCSCFVCLVVGACSFDQSAIEKSQTTKQSKPEKTPLNAPNQPANAHYIFRAKYHLSKGPCIKLGKGWAMPVIDAFEVVKVVKGNLRAKWIEIRLHTGGGPGYPKSLVDGKVYNLRLIPSKETGKQMQKNEKKGVTAISVDGNEIVEHKTND